MGGEDRGERSLLAYRSVEIAGHVEAGIGSEEHLLNGIRVEFAATVDHRVEWHGFGPWPQARRYEDPLSNLASACLP